ncbi:MAG TPA: hemerythrin domain-containing protein [Thermaerobacter sp.]
MSQGRSSGASLPGRSVGTGDRALRILADHHRRLGQLLADAREAGAAHRPDLVAELMDELDAHRRLEQEVFYPALRRTGDATVADHLAARAAEHRQLERLAGHLGRAVEEGLVLDGGPGQPDGGADPAGAASLAPDGRSAQPAGAESRAAEARSGGPGGRGPATEGTGGDPRLGPAGDGQVGSPERLLDRLAAALADHVRREEGELFPLASRLLGGVLANLALELERGREEFRFDYDDVVEGTFPASDPPATMAAPRIRTPRLYARSRKGARP